MSSGINWRQLAGLCWLGVYPAKRLHVFEVRMVWQIVWQTAALESANLRDHNDASDFFHELIVFWRDAIQQTCNLDAKVTDADETLQQVLGEHVGAT